MVLAKITGPGLTSIALLVISLWACIVGEHLIVRRANRDFKQAMNEIRAMQSKKRAVPASAPAIRHNLRPAIS